MNTVNKPFRKKDAMQLVTGQPVYMDDVIPQDCLIVKLLRSPHANAMVRTINTTVAKKVPGIEAIFTWEDVPQDAPRYTQAGQTFPEASPRDRLVIDRHVRFVGDVVAIVAGKDEKCVDKALKLIKVDYEVLEPVLDFHTAKDNPVLVHPEDNWESLSPVGADNKRNLCAHDECGSGDIDAVLAGCDVVIDHVYHTKACQQAMMETFRTYCSIDTYGRLNVLSSTQIVFHARRNIANALHIPKSMVRVAKPRVGLLNIGTEDSKGTDLQKQTLALLRQAGERGDLRFIGNIEAKEAIKGGCDVIVTDGFSGNILLKTMEGVGSFAGHALGDIFKKNLLTKLAAAMVMPGLRAFKAQLDPNKVGGTAFIGISKPVIKAHGASNAEAIDNAIGQARQVAESGIIGQIQENVHLMQLQAE